MTTNDAALRPLADLFDLTGRVAVVTGAAMGIGRAVAERLARSGASVVIADRDGVAADDVAAELKQRGHDALGVRVDVAHEPDVTALFETTVRWRTRVDILVNNAGIYPSTPVSAMSMEQFESVLRVNLVGSFLCCRSAAALMPRGGSIVNITSIDALHPSAVGLAHYDASKHGLWGFTRNLALELAPRGIRVNALAPGAIATPGVAHMQAAAGQAAEDMLAAFLARIPLGRIGEPDDIARLVLVLASDASAYMTGSQVVVDGGALLA